MAMFSKITSKRTEIFASNVIVYDIFIYMLYAMCAMYDKRKISIR